MLPAPASVGTKPARLRTACNQCCGAKLKCSGERTGCQRCRTIRTQCIYQESRVGKVPGIRATKRRRAKEQTTESRAQMTAPPASMITSSSTFTSSLAEDDALARRAHETVPGGPEHSAGFLQYPVPTMTCAGDSYNLPAMDFHMESPSQAFPASPPPSSTQTGEPRRVQTSVMQAPQSVANQQRDRSDSQFIIFCTQIVGDLESYIAADIKSFKIVLGLAKQALGIVIQLSDTPQAARNVRCTILLSVIMYQIVELLDACHALLVEDADRQCNPLFAPRPATNLLLPSLGLGDSGVYAKEQNAWLSQLVLKEVRQAVEVTRKMKVLVATGEQAQARQAIPRGEYLGDLELRLTELAGRIARRRE